MQDLEAREIEAVSGGAELGDCLNPNPPQEKPKTLIQVIIDLLF